MLKDLIFLVLFGGLVGWLASLIVGRSRQMGCLANVVVGVLGAVVGGLIMNLLGLHGPTVVGLNLYSIVVGVLGAILLLAGLGLYKK